MTPPAITIVVPTFNEAPNIAEFVRRTTTAAEESGLAVEILFVDDSTDDTPRVVREVAATAPVPVRLLHREKATGGLGGAVVEGILTATNDVCVVIDGDLQHPPEKIPELVRRYRRGDADVVVASRYAGGGTAHGLAGRVRVAISRLSTLVTKAMFPMRLRAITDPMTGFFLIDRTRVDFADVKPRGFKILLEILARQNLRTAEIDFDFADRYAGESKASIRQGLRFLMQLTHLRFGKMSLFAVIGGLGAVANLAIVWAMTQWGIDYLIAAIVAAEVTIVANFLLIERFVFREMRSDASSFWSRFAKSVSFNNAELLIRIPIVALMVETWHITAVVATAITLVVAFFARFVFHALVVYAPRRTGRSAIRRLAEEIDEQAMSPGEL
ncbi:MAG: glycosyltransferase family 2 protein [Microbacterium sp.]